jgi:MoaA/NifB/PqqE/SkfB family radical SAM enzyme
MSKEQYQRIPPAELSEYRSYTIALAIEGDQKSVVRDMVLQNPSISSADIMKKLGISAQELIEEYRSLQEDEEFQLAVDSSFYSRRLMFNVARTVVRDFASDPIYAARLAAGEPVSSRVVELHTTKGTCNYSCVMCLWSDKREKTYETKKMKGKGLVGLDEWENILSSIHDLGAKVAVFSGGGEVLLNSDFFQLLDFSHNVGLKTQLYTSGYNMQGLSDYEWSQLLNMDRIRFSIHSPNEDTYNDIVKMPTKSNAILKVQENLIELLQKRNTTNLDLRVGIGFVIQPLNALEVEGIINFAKSMGVDFLNIRRDEILVTNPLSAEDESQLREQLLRIRSGIIQGQYGQLEIDFSDNLTAFMNSEDYSLEKTANCVIKSFRPTVTPYGQWMPCDLKGEPMYADPNYVIGNLHDESVEKVLANSQKMTIPASCSSCMPSGQTGNAIFSKLLADYAQGIDFRDQPFY